jgi:hypothetical protein
MDTELLERKFARLGARLKIRTQPRVDSVSIDIRRDHKGEYFDVQVNPDRNLFLDAIDVRPAERHLLLMSARHDTESRKPKLTQKQKFLCGHDERAWFAAAIPESAGASNVRTAMEALKPVGVRLSQARHRVPMRKLNRRKNLGFVRQGEWFFVPCPDLVIDQAAVLRNEPLQRSGNKAHWAEFAVRFGGETVYVSRNYPNGISANQFHLLKATEPNASKDFRVMQRNATVFVRGRIRHPDHKTVMLNCWHRVEMNTEHKAWARRNVVFLD